MHRPFCGKTSRNQPSKCLRKSYRTERRNLAHLVSGRSWKASIRSKERVPKCKSMLQGLGSVNQDAASFAFTAVAALSFVKFFDKLAEWDIFDSKTSRKLLHLSTGPLFVLCWPFYSSHPNAKFVAMLTPMLNLIRLVLIGSGVVDGKFAVKAASRSGDRFELLRGPMYYVITLIFVTFLWRDSPLSMLIMSTVCVGDGLADLVGRRFGREIKLPYNKDKSVAGSAAMFFFRIYLLHVILGIVSVLELLFTYHSTTYYFKCGCCIWSCIGGVFANHKVCGRQHLCSNCFFDSWQGVAAPVTYAETPSYIRKEALLTSYIRVVLKPSCPLSRTKQWHEENELNGSPFQTSS
mmetsp:Transcript_9098/g.55419  ORF Transcript_9098/g.55419 Transcript_9098/m.55419 type:complete len:350 (-) Transcript_9098:709-1758(-)